MSTKFNVYYATSANGPWNLANTEPLDHVPSGNEFTISGLEVGVIYFVAVVGGKIENSEFVPLLHQEIGPSAKGAGDLSVIESYPRYQIKTFAPKKITEGSLGHIFSVT